MARQRIIKPDFWQDEKIATVSYAARLLYIGLWNCSDDFGVVRGSPVYLRNNIFPYDESMTLDLLSATIKELEDLKRIILFKNNNETYYYLPKFLEHQYIQRPSTKNRNPSPPNKILRECSVSTP